MNLDQGQWMTLTFDIHIGSCNHLVSEKSIVLPFSPYKSIRDQDWTCRKIDQGQPRVIIWTNLAVLEHPMPHTKFQGHRLFGSGDEDFLRFLPYMDMAAVLVLWPGLDQLNKLSFHGGSIWNLTWIAQWFLRRRCLKMLTYTHIRTTEAYPISSPPFGSGELKRK